MDTENTWPGAPRRLKLLTCLSHIDLVELRRELKRRGRAARVEILGDPFSGWGNEQILVFALAQSRLSDHYTVRTKHPNRVQQLLRWVELEAPRISRARHDWLGSEGPLGYSRDNAFVGAVPQLDALHAITRHELRRVRDRKDFRGPESHICEYDLHHFPLQTWPLPNLVVLGPDDQPVAHPEVGCTEIAEQLADAALDLVSALGTTRQAGAAARVILAAAQERAANRTPLTTTCAFEGVLAPDLVATERDMLAASLGDMLGAGEASGVPDEVLELVNSRLQPWFSAEYARRARERLGWR